MQKVKYCKNCYGLYPCWCKNKFYITTWEFIYKAFRRLKGDK